MDSIWNQVNILKIVKILLINRRILKVKKYLDWMRRFLRDCHLQKKSEIFFSRMNKKHNTTVDMIKK